MFFDALNLNRAERAAYAETVAGMVARGPVSSAYAVRTASFLFWGQHCHECAAPACYRTCGLYERAADHRCQTFVFGLGRNRGLTSFHDSAIECAFKGHAHLFTHLTLPQFSLLSLRRAERLHARWLEPTLRLIDFPLRRAGLRSLAQRASTWAWTQLLYRLERRRRGEPDGFLLQAISPYVEPVPFLVTIYNDPRGSTDPIFQETLLLREGFNELLIPIERIGERVDLQRPARISLYPSGDGGRVLLILAADLVGLEAAPQAAPADRPPIKCLVFDLDNTLWEGTLVEGAGGRRLRPGVEWLLRRLDERGILLSVASKNPAEQAVAALRRLGVEELFLHPQITWEPKSGSLRAIAESLNIGLDTLAFVDDSAFERAEVVRHCPDVLLLEPTDLPLLHRHPLFQGAHSPESRRRRELYRQDLNRRADQAEAHTDYEAFLRSCGIRVRIGRPEVAYFERLHELIQRTNQLNFSGNRYTRDDLAHLLNDPSKEVFILHVEDRYGDYGLVGLAVVQTDGEAPRLIDMALSCRVMAKRVEHGLLTTLMRVYRGRGARRLEVDYRRTPRNAPAGRVFDDLAFSLIEGQGETLRLTRDLAGEITPPEGLQIECSLDSS